MQVFNLLSLIIYTLIAYICVCVCGGVYINVTTKHLTSMFNMKRVYKMDIIYYVIMRFVFNSLSSRHMRCLVYLLLVPSFFSSICFSVSYKMILISLTIQKWYKYNTMYAWTFNQFFSTYLQYLFLFINSSFRIIVVS